MLNVLTILADNDQGIPEPRVKIHGDVLDDTTTGVSIVEFCLAGSDCESGESGATVNVAKRNYNVTDMMVFRFKSFDDTESLVTNFTEFVLENPETNPDAVTDAAVFMDMLSELIVDAEEEDKGRCVQVVSTLLEPVREKND